MPKKRQWTEDQDRLIQKLYSRPGGPAKLVRKLGINIHAIKRRAGQLGSTKCSFRWTQETEDMLRKRYQTDGPTKLAKELGIGMYAVMAKAGRLGIGATRKTPPKGFKWTEAMLTAIKERYVKEGAELLAQEFGVTRFTIYNKAGEFGLHTIAGHAVAGRIRAERSTSCDIHYFDQWTSNNAYILGYMFADGCVDKNLYSVGFCISAKDRSVLQFIKDELKATKQIFEQEVQDDRGWNVKPQCTFSICSSVLVGRLVEMGLKPRKTYNDDPFPEIPDEFLSDFARGYLDGDGWVSISKGDGCYVGFVGSVKFIKGLRDSLVRLANVSHKKVQITKGKTVNYAHVYWSAYKDVGLLNEFLYPLGFSFCLERKRNKLKEWLLRPHKELYSWTPEEIQFVKDQYSTLGPRKTAEALGKTVDAVKAKKKGLGLTPLKKRKF